MKLLTGKGRHPDEVLGLRQPAAAFGNAACCEPAGMGAQIPPAAGCVAQSGSRLPQSKARALKFRLYQP